MIKNVMEKTSHSLFSWMQQFAVTAGAIALSRQRNITDIGKARYDLAGGKESAAGSAKTVVDEIIQELFLAHVSMRWPNISINVEEDTPLVSLFTYTQKRKKSSLAIHLDPIDGTLSYIKGEKEFAIGLAISDARNIFTHTVVYAPALKKLYVASPMRRVVQSGSRIINSAPRKNPPRIIYEKRLLSEQGRHKLQALGFAFAPLQSSHLAIINTSLGHASAFLYGASNPHDGMIPAAFAKAYGVLPYTTKGKLLRPSDLDFTYTGQFLSFSRIPSLCYYSCDQKMQTKIKEILLQKENLHEEYVSCFAAREK